MARVTVEDCIDKVENRFDLVLLASHRARMISSGAQIAVERDKDRTPLWRCGKLPNWPFRPGTSRRSWSIRCRNTSRWISPEPEAVPLIGAPGTGVDADDTDVTTDRMSEEELLKGLEGLIPPESEPEPDTGDEEE